MLNSVPLARTCLNVQEPCNCCVTRHETWTAFFSSLFSLEAKFMWSIFLLTARVWGGCFAVPVFLTYLKIKTRLKTLVGGHTTKQSPRASPDLCTPLTHWFTYLCKTGNSILIAVYKFFCERQTCSSATSHDILMFRFTHLLTSTN